MKHNLRLLAATVVNDVLDGRSLADCLEPVLNKIPDSRDKALVQAICYGVCRFYTRLDVILSYLLKKPMAAKESLIYSLLLVGLYQLIYMRVPSHAAVDETVKAVETLKKPWARGLINAILREFLRQQNAIEEEIKTDDEAEYAHPFWWIKKLKQEWPENWEMILRANNELPPFSLRVNQQHLSREAYLEKLTDAHVISETDSGIILTHPVPVEELPGFAAGDVSIQDGAAQLAAQCLALAPNQRVLDACAAPGGKLTHLCEIEPTLEIVAIEKESHRIASIKENLQRLQCGEHVTTICKDAGNVKNWWDDKPFDHILLDSPCSASGVVRRHPDIKLLRQENDISALSKEQLRLLNALWPTLKSGGTFLYVTCSIFSEENELVMKEFLNSHPDAAEEKLNVSWGIERSIGRQILPGMHEMDGFYFAKLKKI